MKTKNLITAFIVSCLVLFAWPVMLFAEIVSLTKVISTASTIEGWNSILWGLQEYAGYDTCLSMSFQMAYTENSATFTLSDNQMLNGKPLSISGSGFLAGNVGSEDLTWTSSWTGSYDGNPLSTNDTAGWLMDEAKVGYSGISFNQTGVVDISSSVIWSVSGAGTASEVVNGSTVPLKTDLLRSTADYVRVDETRDITVTTPEKTTSSTGTLNQKYSLTNSSGGVTGYDTLAKLAAKDGGINPTMIKSLGTFGGGAGSGCGSPEPATVCLLGLGGLALMPRRR